jgi:hypothetical protein
LNFSEVVMCKVKLNVRLEWFPWADRRLMLRYLRRGRRCVRWKVVPCCIARCSYFDEILVRFFADHWHKLTCQQRMKVEG